MTKPLSRRDALKRMLGTSAGFAVGSLASLAAAHDASPRMNVLFIMTDQQRWDAMGIAGNREISTPNLDRLAREGALFENAVSACPICVPARASMLTGCSIESTQVRGNGDYDKPGAGADTGTFDDMLTANGYRSEYYGKWHAPYRYAACYSNSVRETGKHSRDSETPGENAAYTEFLRKHVSARDLKPGELLDKNADSPYVPLPVDARYAALMNGTLSANAIRGKHDRDKKNSGETGEAYGQSGSYGRLDIPAEYSRTAFTAVETMAALERLKDGPFSLTCSFGPPHPPMVVPSPYYERFPAASLSASPSGNDPMDNSPYAARASLDDMRRMRNPDFIRQMKQVYYGLVAEDDFWIGKILDKLASLGLERNTLVLFTSDHGEMLGDHGLISKMCFYEGAVHIPLIMRLPGVIRANTRVTSPVSQIDYAPTVLDLAGVRAPAAEGYSLRPLLTGLGGSRDFSVSEWGSSKGPTEMIRTARWKFICAHGKTDGVDALFDLEHDPLEMNNLIGKNQHRLDHLPQAMTMKDMLVAWLEKTHSPRADGVKRHTIV